MNSIKSWELSENRGGSLYSQPGCSCSYFGSEDLKSSPPQSRESTRTSVERSVPGGRHTENWSKPKGTQREHERPGTERLKSRGLLPTRRALGRSIDSSLGQDPELVGEALLGSVSLWKHRRSVWGQAGTALVALLLAVTLTLLLILFGPGGDHSLSERVIAASIRTCY